MTAKSIQELMDEAYRIQCEFINGSDPDDVSLTNFIAANEEGKLFVYVTPFDGEDSKRAVVSLLRGEFKKHNVVHYVMATEAWVSKQKIDEERKYETASEDPNRADVLMITGVGRDGTVISLSAEIIVADDNKRHVDSSVTISDYDSIAGRMTELLK